MAERLCALRKQRKLTQVALAQQLQITPEPVSRYELGKDTPRYSVLIRMARVLGTTTDYLLGASAETSISPLVTFSEQEQQIIAEFRQLSQNSQERAIGYIHGAKENQMNP